MNGILGLVAAFNGMPCTAEEFPPSRGIMCFAYQINITGQSESSPVKM